MKEIQDYMVGQLNKIPSYMVEPLKRWIYDGAPHPDDMGSFLRSVLEHNFFVAALMADDENAAKLRDWALTLYNDVPCLAHGSRELVLAWHERGGLRGIREGR